MYVLDHDHRQAGQLSSPFQYFQFRIGLDKYLSALHLKMLCTKALSQIPGYGHDSTKPVYLSLKNLWVWPILFSSRAVLLLALSAKSICAVCEEWQPSSASARLDNVLLNWVYQIGGGTQSLKGRVQTHYKVIYLYQRATPGTIQWFCRLPVMAALLLKACDRDGFCSNNFF